MNSPQGIGHNARSHEFVIENKQKLEQEIRRMEQELNNLKSLKHFKKPELIRIEKLENEIQRLKSLVIAHEKLISLTPGSWVHNGSAQPGEVIDIRVTGKIPEAYIKWWGSKACIPEPPTKLTLISPEKMEFIWSGDRLPRLIRIQDHHECDQSSLLQAELTKLSPEDEDYRAKKAYLTKRISFIEQRDFNDLEATVNQGLKVFFRVGEALAEISDRKLYKLAGYADFRVYLKDRWNMGKSQAYRLIGASKVVTNLIDSESVPHGGQSENAVLPSNERVARELGKVEESLQPQVWEKAVNRADGDPPTVSHVKQVTQELKTESSIDKEIPERNLINDFSQGQLVRVNPPKDRPDKRLVGLAQSVALVTKVNPASVNLRIFHQTITEVSPNDLEVLTPSQSFTFCLDLNQGQYSKVLEFESKEKFVDFVFSAIA